MNLYKVFYLICLLALFSIIPFKGISQTEPYSTSPPLDASSEMVRLWEVGQFEPSPITDLSGEYRLCNVWRNKYLHQVYDYDNCSVSTEFLNVDWESQIWEVKAEGDGTWRLQCKWKERYLNAGAVENGTAMTVFFAFNFRNKLLR